MHWVEWFVGAMIALFVLGVGFLALGSLLARSWSGEQVGTMRVTKWYANGVHHRLRVAVRRSVHGPQPMRDVHVLVGAGFSPDTVVLNQVEAVRCAELLERAAAESRR